MLDLPPEIQALVNRTATTGAAPAAGSNLVNLSGIPSGTTAAYAGQDWNKFWTDYGPLIQKQMSSLNSTDMVDKARADSRVAPGLMTGAVDRAIARRGGATATQRLALDASRPITAATTSADLINNARMDQRQRNVDTAQKMSALGTDIYNMGLDNVRESEGLAAQRRINNANAKASAKSANMGAAASVAMTAAVLF